MTAALVVTVGSFFAVQPLIDVAQHAATELAVPLAARALRSRATTAWTQKIARQASKAERASVGTAPSVTAGARTAAPTTTRASTTVQSSACRCSFAPSSTRPKASSAATAAAGTASEQRVERELVEPCPVRRRGRDHEPDRYRPARHAQVFGVRLRGSSVTLSAPVRKER